MANKLVYEAGGRKIEIEFVKPPERGPRCETCRFYSGAQEREDGGERLRLGSACDYHHGLQQIGVSAAFGRKCYPITGAACPPLPGTL